MEHVAIMRKSWGLTQKILEGQKKIESRWYSARYKPWNGIKKGETIYFKDSGQPVTIKARVSKVLQFSNLNPGRVKEILDQYGFDDGLEQGNRHKFFQRFKNKNYCMLIFLKDPQKVEPFEIDKKGFGAMSAWLSVEHIDRIKVHKA